MSLIVDINPVPWEILDLVRARILKNRAKKQRRQPEKPGELRRVMQVDNGILAKQRWEQPSFIGGGKTPYIAFVNSLRTAYYIDYWLVNELIKQNIDPGQTGYKQSAAIDYSFYINNYQPGEANGYPSNYTPTRLKLLEFQLPTQLADLEASFSGDIFENQLYPINHAEGFLFIWSNSASDQDQVKQFASLVPNLANLTASVSGASNKLIENSFYLRPITKWTIYFIDSNEPQPGDSTTFSGTVSYGSTRGYLYYGFVEDLERSQAEATSVMEANNSGKVINSQNETIFMFVNFDFLIYKYTEIPQPYSFFYSKDRGTGLSFPDD
jgi:hypothetical protein